MAAIYDIHGNIDALEAVLTAAETETVDRIVVGGDIAWGPFPAEAVGRVRGLGERTAVIRGNADREVAARTDEDDGLEEWVAEVNTWCADRLGDEEREFLASLPDSVVVPVGGIGDVLFCHGTPRSDEGIVTPITPPDDAAAILSGVQQKIVVCGHTHSQFDRLAGDRRLVNAGSVGLPYEDAPGAYWAILGPDVALKRTEYDIAEAAVRMRTSGCPYSERFADAVISPLPRSAAIEHFENRRPRL